jgi:hypothetical protein
LNAYASSPLAMRTLLLTLETAAAAPIDQRVTRWPPDFVRAGDR